jgi:hypothetical protein
MLPPVVSRSFTALVALVAWSALVLQYALLIGTTLDTIGPGFATLRFISFFTILANLLVALTTSFALAGTGTRIGTLFANARVRGGVALYIAVTGAIYFFVLRTLWAPQGLQWLADVTLHYAVPLLYLAWWITCVEHGRLRFSDALRWLLVPLVYLIWTILRGAWLHEYPYPFVDIDALGAASVMINCALVCLLFATLGMVLIGIDRTLARARR